MAKKPAPKLSSLTYDIVIRCGRLLTMREGQPEVLLDQCLAIQGPRIVRIEKWKRTPYRAKKIIDASDKLIMPGLINGHTHLPMSLFRGLADDLPFHDWLFKYILPLESRLVSPEFVRLGAELSLYESLLSGTTTLCDMYYFQSDAAKVVDRSGLRAILGECAADFPRPDDKKNDGACYRILDEMCERYQGHGRITPSIESHAPYSSSDATLKRNLAYAQKKNIPFQIHVSETKQEVENSFKEFRESPVARIARIGILDTPSILAHCVHLDDADIALIAKSQAGVIHNPECNMKLGSGIAPIVKMLKAGVKVGLGTDGPASNNNLNLFGEMDIAAKLQKLAASDNSAMGAKEALHMATLGGAQAIGMAKDIGSLEVGKYADLLILDLKGPQWHPLHDVASQLVYSANGSEVETVLCHGKILLEKRKARFVDPEDLYARIARYRKRSKF